MINTWNHDLVINTWKIHQYYCKKKQAINKKKFREPSVSTQIKLKEHLDLADYSHSILMPTGPLYPLRGIRFWKGHSVQLGKTYEGQNHFYLVHNFFRQCYWSSQDHHLILIIIIYFAKITISQIILRLPPYHRNGQRHGLFLVIVPVT